MRISESVLRRPVRHTETRSREPMPPSPQRRHQDRVATIGAASFRCDCPLGGRCGDGPSPTAARPARGSVPSPGDAPCIACPDTTRLGNHDVARLSCTSAQRAGRLQAGHPNASRNRRGVGRGPSPRGALHRRGSHIAAWVDAGRMPACTPNDIPCSTPVSASLGDERDSSSIGRRKNHRTSRATAPAHHTVHTSREGVYRVSYIR